MSVALIGRLAVDSSMKGQGLGKEFLFHAIDRAEKVGKKIGLRAVVVDAKNKSAEEFYLKYGFDHFLLTKHLISDTHMKRAPIKNLYSHCFVPFVSWYWHKNLPLFLKHPPIFVKLLNTK